MNKIIFLVLFGLLCNSIKAQSNTISELTVNSVAVPAGGAIEFGNSTSVVVRFRTTFVKPNNLTIGTVSHVIGTQTNSGFTQLITPELIPQGINNTGFTGLWEKTLYASDYSISGNHFLKSVVQQTTDSPNFQDLKWESALIPIRRTPVFSISPTSINYISCGNTAPRLFTVNNSGLPAGSSVLYNWNIGNGWSGAVSNTSNSVTLTPNSGTILPSSVVVTPIYNGIAQPSLTFVVQRSPINSSATITGATGVCAGSSSYLLSAIESGQAVTWSLSNNSLATLSNSSSSGTTVSFFGNGAQTLTALITNQCGQSVTKTFQINTGSTLFNSAATISAVTINTCVTSRNVFMNNLPAGQNVSWSVSDPNIATITTISNTQAVVNFINSGNITVFGIVSNNCGQTSTKSIQIYNGAPTLLLFTCGNLSKPFCTNSQLFAYSSALPDLNRNDRVNAVFSGMTATESNTFLNWEWQPLNNKVSISSAMNSTSIGSIFFGQTGVRVRAKNARGWSQWYNLEWEMVELPDPFWNRTIAETSNELIISPNPTRNQWNFEFNNEIIQNIEIIDILGNRVKTEVFNSNMTEIDASSLAKGIYFAIIKTDKNTLKKKLIKE